MAKQEFSIPALMAQVPTEFDAYLSEFDYRYSTCHISDSQRMRRLLGQTGGRRLTYKPLTDG